ncbi:MAG: hypothetical protein WA951_09435 [Leeuwenhoekiella sp.]
MKNSKEEKVFATKTDTTLIETTNNSKTLNLKVEKIISFQDPRPVLNYKVIKQETQEIILSDTYRGSDVLWNDNSSLKLIPYAGIERKPSSDNPDEVASGTTQSNAVIVKLDSLE